MIQSMCQDSRDAREKTFPEQTTVRYHTLPVHPEERAAPAGQILVNRTYPPPVEVIDGEPRFAGSIQTAKIVEAAGAKFGT